MNMQQQEQASAVPAIGEFIEGGFFTGIIRINGQRFGVVVAPKAEGEFKSIWSKTGKKIDARHLADGAANTQAMLDAGSPIATWARGLDISGHQDWYIPARDELELIYRNLKPTDDENMASFRDGENPSSDPVGELYTDEDPAQTSVLNFQTDGDQAMEETWYWASTQYSADDAFVQDFSDGYQLILIKDTAWRVRAVRRFLIN